MVSVLECAMLACFGFSWPINMVKSFKSRTAKGKSLFFELLIVAGYVFGIGSKLLNRSTNWVLILYFINIVFVTIDICFTLRNKRLDSNNESLASADDTQTVKKLDYCSIGETALKKYKAENACADVDTESETSQGKVLNYREIGERALEKYNSENFSNI